MPDSDQNQQLSIRVPAGWTIAYCDPTLASDEWEAKEDLLQLRHPGLDRLVDLGWYRDRFRICVFQGDFQGALLSERTARDVRAARSVLHVLLQQFSEP